jgi:hypothetical protein
MSDKDFCIRSTDMPESENFIRLQRRFDKHVEEYRDHLIEHERKEMQHLLQQELTSRNLAELTRALELQAQLVKGPVEGWNTIRNLQKFILWLSGFSLVGALIVWYTDTFNK